MNRHSLAWVLAAGMASLLVTACGGNNPNYVTSASPTPPVYVPGAGIAPPRFAYVVNRGTSNVSGFSVNATSGLLTPIAGAGSPWVTGTNPESIAVDPGVRFAYVANNGSNNVSVFNINSDGSLTANGLPATAGSQPTAVTVDPQGRYVYVANGDIAASTISAYSLNSTTGQLTPIAGSPFASTGTNPRSIAVDPTGKFVYVANFASSSISIYSIDTSSTGGHVPGALILQGTVTTTVDSPNSITVVTSATGIYAYVANFGNDSVTAYSVNTTNGALTPTNPGLALSGGTTPTSVAVEPNGKFAYVTNLSLPGTGNVAAFSIGQAVGNAGALTALGGASATAALTGGAPYSVAADPSGKFIYAVQSATNQITGFTLNATTGALTPMSTQFATETGSPPPTSDGRFILITK
ncbi:lactonase family protein [Aquabacterium sp.]|uniref:lactonase family protein n=1 Tax=Aquabacterium sp. TaxID=1872578 RepID=UPI003D6D6731